MSDRRIAILVDGGFFLKRLPRIVPDRRRRSAESVVGLLRLMCRNHVKALTGTDGKRWLDNVYRIFFYDAVPYTGQAHHPLHNLQVDFGASDTARFRHDLFECLRRQRKVALRLGKVVREGDWTPPSEKTRRILGTKAWLAGLDLTAIPAGGAMQLSKDQVREAIRLQQRWSAIEPDDVRLNLRQKGVDMRIGIDIASITLKRQANTILLVAGDSDFVPAAKLARREGVEFILDPMWQTVNAELFEHIDGLQSGLTRPKRAPAPAEAPQPEAANG